MPLCVSDFPSEMQVAFFMFSLFPDWWDGMSGAYLGKDWSCLGPIFDMYGIEDRTNIFFLMKIYEIEIIKYRSKVLSDKIASEDRKGKQASRISKGGKPSGGTAVKG